MREKPGKEPWSLRFRRERDRYWRRLDRLVEKAARKGPRGLSPEEAAEIPSLYRVALSSLSVARAAVLERNLVEYLESLAARAWLLLYCPPSRGTRRFLSVLAREFPAAVRRLGFPLLLGTFAFLLGVVLAWASVSASPEWFYAFVEPALAAGRDPWAAREALEKALYGGGDFGTALSVFAGFLFTHNAQVGILAFSVGIAGGVPAAILLFWNGLTLGAFLAVYSGKGLLLPFLGWLLPHGVPEISAMILCGAAGLDLGRALLFPGRLSRGASLKRAGRNGAVTAAGAFLLFAWAGFMEGVFRQLVRSDALRAGAVLLDLAVLAFWFRRGGGRGDGS